nr:hypothetical protein Iba_chr12aCG7310 [Ipomoea batatas]GMD70324.1 hypothetical protein Iba_chr12eCG5190 [Ipomoea batatas]
MAKLKYLVDYSVAYRSWKEFTANALPLYTTPIRRLASSICAGNRRPQPPRHVKLQFVGFLNRFVLR